MLVFKETALFEAIYDVAKEIYPEIKDVRTLVSFSNCKEGVQLLEGTEEDKGTYKIAVNVSELNDQHSNSLLFITGLSMLVYKLKAGEYMHPIIHNEPETVSEYYEIAKSISDKFHETYGASNETEFEYIIE